MVNYLELDGKSLSTKHAFVAYLNDQQWMLTNPGGESLKVHVTTPAAKLTSYFDKSISAEIFEYTASEEGMLKFDNQLKHKRKLASNAKTRKVQRHKKKHLVMKQASAMAISNSELSQFTSRAPRIEFD